MSRFIRDPESPLEVTQILQARQEREAIVSELIRDLTVAAEGLGQTAAQVDAKLDALFLTFGNEWDTFERTGSTAIITTIQNDATLLWLDTDVAGTTIRQRLINRLS